jgi:flagellar capping protein FliD
LERIISDAEQQLTTFYSLEEAQNAYDQQKSINELYVEEYDKLYQINKLSREINKSMSDIDSLAANRKLSDLLDEINEKRESGVEMSQYELDNLNKKYQLRLAEIALEEA